jgi:hypothetical protein
LELRRSRASGAEGIAKFGKQSETFQDFGFPAINAFEEVCANAKEAAVRAAWPWDLHRRVVFSPNDWKRSPAVGAMRSVAAAARASKFFGVEAKKRLIRGFK